MYIVQFNSSQILSNCRHIFIKSWNIFVPLRNQKVLSLPMRFSKSFIRELRAFMYFTDNIEMLHF